jgi:electron transport complex protein RnfC
MHDLPLFAAVGTSVRRGESLVRQPAGGRVVPLAPVDGRITGHTSVTISRDRSCAGIALEPLTSEDESGGSPKEEAVVKSDSAIAGLTLGELAGRLEKLGVWADRWASPDLLAQLRGPHRKPIDTILCNALDEDPAVPLQATVVADRAGDVVAGVKVLAAAAGNARSLLVLAQYAPLDAWQGARAASSGTALRLVPMRNEYPQSHPSLLVHELTGRHLRPGQLPIEHGVLLLDAAAAAAVGRAAAFGEPMESNPLAVHDYLRRKTHWLTVPIGSVIRDVLEEVAVPLEDVELRAGCPLREVRLTPDCVIGGAELTIAIVPAEADVNPEPCIRCAWCVEGCPVRIRPAGLLDAAQQEDLYLAGQCGLDACIECGICSYVCPSQLPLLGGIRVLRQLRS